MKKHYLFALAAMCNVYAQAQEDLTSLLANPSFEADKASELTADAKTGHYKIALDKVTGWTVTNNTGSGFAKSMIMTAMADDTDNDYGVPNAPTDGDQMYYLRDSWVKKNFDASVMQTVELEAGVYKFQIDIQHNGAADSYVASIIAGEDLVAIPANTFPSNKTAPFPAWSTAEVSFTLKETKSVSLGVKITYGNNKSGASLIFDNAKLFKTGEYVTPPPIDGDDITSTKLVNPSFEMDATSSLTADSKAGRFEATELTGWTITSNGASSLIMDKDVTETDNGFGVPGAAADGDLVYYMRSAWANREASIMQDVTLDAGYYVLTVDSKCVGLTGLQKCYLVAGEKQIELPLKCVTPSDWTTTKRSFTLTEAKTISIGVKASFKNAGGSSFMLDNFRLYKLEKPSSTNSIDANKKIVSKKTYDTNGHISNAKGLKIVVTTYSDGSVESAKVIVK